jgi:tetratricopeptide (TPR) repeat protein
MSAIRSAACLLVLLAAIAAAGPRRVQADAPPAPEMSAAQQAIVDYLRDPNSNGRRLLDVARQETTGEVSPVHEIFIGDAASRAGLYRTAAIWFADARDRSVQPSVTGAAEFGLAWSALGRGAFAEARDHFAAAAAADAGLQPTSDFASAMLAAADETADARSLLANVAATATDPSLREASPLLAAYSLYWSGDMLGAAAAFMSFSIANPDSRFTDDALYAAAVAKQQAGRTSEAREELEALAGDGHARGRVPTRLMELDPRAVLREGMRRDRDRPTRLAQRRVTDLLDGDGVRLARAALEDRGEEAQDPGRPAKHHHHALGAQAVVDATPSNAAAPPKAATDPAPARRTETPGTTAPPPAHTRFPWSTLAVVVLFAVVGSYLLARRAQQRTSGQRR